MAIDYDEALRYSGVRKPDEGMRREMAGIGEELLKQIRPRKIWKLFPVRHTMEGVLLGDDGILLTGSIAGVMLRDCSRAAVMACTLGTAFDSMLRVIQQRDMARALMTDACGSAYVEAVCGETEAEIAKANPGYFLTDRFSPGYGDLSLDLQRPLLQAIDAERRTGITLLESKLMNPSKSVTAIIGLSGRPQQARIRGCAFCSLAEQCTFRKRGDHCGDQN